MSFASGPYRVYRGGGCGSDPRYARVAYRYYGTPGSRSSGFGLRLVRRCT